MKQKELTEKQKEILVRLECALQDANDNNIGFLFDEDDCSLTAFNAENVNIPYSGRSKESDNDERIDWDSSSIIGSFRADYFNNNFDNFYLHFEEE